MVTTHIHDNRRQRDDHLVPFEGSINWAATIMELEKIGYDGVLMYKGQERGQPPGRARAGGGRPPQLEDLSATSSQLIADN